MSNTNTRTRLTLSQIQERGDALEDQIGRSVRIRKVTSGPYTVTINGFDPAEFGGQQAAQATLDFLNAVGVGYTIASAGDVNG